MRLDLHQVHPLTHGDESNTDGSADRTKSGMKGTQTKDDEEAHRAQYCHPPSRAAHAGKMFDGGGALVIVGCLGDELSVCSF